MTSRTTPTDRTHRSGRSGPPAERVRARLARLAGPLLAATMPSGYQRLGQVLLLRLPGPLRAYAPAIGTAWQAELGVATVLVVDGPVEGEYRTPRVERVAGTDTETEVVEHGVRWRFDAARIMFAAGNRTERRRAGRLVRRGEVVVDLFAGIGYFALPAALAGASEVRAVEKNPLAAQYLALNAEANGVGDRVRIWTGDNRTVPLPRGEADRIFLGYLPSAVPWVGRAIELLRPVGGVLHVHAVADAREARASAQGAVEAAVRAAGAELLGPTAAREVKPYGPGRAHVVVDAAVRPGAVA